MAKGRKKRPADISNQGEGKGEKREGGFARDGESIYSMCIIPGEYGLV